MRHRKSEIINSDGISNRFGIKLLTKIRVGFSDLREHRCNYKLKDEFYFEQFNVTKHSYSFSSCCPEHYSMLVSISTAIKAYKICFCANTTFWTSGCG